MADINNAVHPYPAQLSVAATSHVPVLTTHELDEKAILVGDCHRKT